MTSAARGVNVAKNFGRRGLTIDDIQPAQISFNVRHARLPPALWVCSDFYPEAVARDRHELFSEQFSYVVPNAKCFDALSFSNSESRHMTAERYGGLGVGENGGAGRCGNFGAYQVKGVGPTPLVGS